MVARYLRHLTSFLFTIAALSGSICPKRIPPWRIGSIHRSTLTARGSSTLSQRTARGHSPHTGKPC